MSNRRANLEDRMAQKPVGITPTGEFLTLEDLAARPELAMGSTFALDLGSQVKLAVERYRYEPEGLKVAALGAGVFSRDEVIAAMEAQTPFGDEAVRAEMHYCNTVVQSLAAAQPAADWPAPPQLIPPDWPEYKKGTRWIWVRLSNRAVFCENTTDGVTGPFATYRIANVHPVFKARGFNVVALTGTDDVRVNFVPQAKSVATVYLSGIGHGGYDVYTGHLGDHILEVGHYDAAEVKPKSIHFLSCQTAGRLGPDTVTNGAKTYAGYTENFYLTWDDGSTPGVNEFELFARSDSTYDIQMAGGATAQQAYNATVQAFNAAMACVPNSAAATWLLWDRDHLKLCGDPAAKIEPFRWIKIPFPLPRPVEDRLVEVEGLVQ